MTYYEWSDRFALGHAGIDEQHRALVGMIDALYVRMAEGEGAAGAAEAVRGLARYARDHFALEERLMRGAGPEADFAAHRAEHAEFTARVAHHLARLDAGERVSPLDLAGYLRDWLSRHILQVDRDLVERVHPSA